MNPTLIEYLGFVVAALILGWAIIEISRRYFLERRKDSKSLNTWVKQDSTFAGDIDASMPDEECYEEDESLSEANIQIRARHNGYHSESKKLL